RGSGSGGGADAGRRRLQPVVRLRRCAYLRGRQTGCRSLAPSTTHSPRRIFSSRHARQTLICVRPGGPHTAVMAPLALAVQCSVWISQTPCRTTPLGSILCIAFSFLLPQGEPLDQSVAGIFHEA